MKKILLTLIMLGFFVGGASLTSVSQIEGNTLHNIQSEWQIADSTTSAGGEPNALTVTERTKLLVDAAIAADVNSDGEISTFNIPSDWTTIKFRAMGISEGGTQTNQIYFGTLGGGLDCELNHAVQFAWVVGQQTSTYYQITFTLGGADGADYVPQPGDTVTGNASGETAIIVSVLLSSGTFEDEDAAGTITYRSASGAFTSSETVSILRANKVLASNAYRHTASGLFAFEMADTLTTTAKSWNTSFTTKSPTDETIAEVSVPILGADYMVVITTTASVDGKLLIKGY